MRGSGLTQCHRKKHVVLEGGLGGISTIFGYYVMDPERFGVVEFNDQMEVVSVEEKPKIPKSNYAAVGLYFYKNYVVDLAQNLNMVCRISSSAAAGRSARN